MSNVNHEGLDSTMLYKVGDGESIVFEGNAVGHKAFADADVEAALADGWHRSPPDAHAAASKKAEPEPEAITREQMEKDAETLGMKVDKRWSDKRLSEELAAAVKKT